MTISHSLTAARAGAINFPAVAEIIQMEIGGSRASDLRNVVMTSLIVGAGRVKVGATQRAPH